MKLKKSKKKKPSKKISITRGLINDALKIRKRIGRSSSPLSFKEREDYITNRFIYELSPKTIQKEFFELANRNFAKDATQLSLFRPVEDLFKAATGTDIGIDKDLSWCLGLLGFHEEIVNFYIKHKKDVETLILGEDLANAAATIDKIDSKCGVSLWSLKLRNAIESDNKDAKSEAGKTIKDLIKKGSCNNYLTSVLRNIDYYSNQDVYFSSVQSDKNNILKFSDFCIKYSFSYHIFPYDFYEEVRYEDIIAYEKNTSIIDIFEFIKRFYEIESINNQTDFKNHVRDFPDNLTDKFGFGWSNFNSLELKQELDRNLFDINSKYIEGKYEEVIKAAENTGLCYLPFPLFELVVKANMRCNKLESDGMIANIIEKMTSIILKDEKSTSASQDLNYLCYKYRTIEWFKDLSIFLNKNQGFISESKVTYFNNLLTIRNKQYSPDQARVWGDYYINKVSESFSDLSSIKLFNEISLERGSKIKSLGLPNDLLTYYIILTKIKQGKHVEVTENLRMIIDGNYDDLIQLDARRHLLDCLVTLEKMTDAIRFFVKEYLAQPNYISIFDIKRVMKAVESSYKKTKDIDCAIVFSIYTRNVDDRYEAQLKFSFESFLIKNNFSRPQELFNKESLFTKEKLHYFLKWVCTLDNMSLYLAFKDIEEISDCRIEICEYLIKKGDTSRSLSNEVVEVRKRKAERIALENADKSRIYVDTNVFTGRDSEQYRVLFDRYLELKKQDYSEYDDEKVFETLYQATKEDLEIRGLGLTIERALSSVIFTNVSLNPKNAIFLGLCKLFRGEFTYGEKGLNGHLSTRIRHGYLPTTISKPFKEESIFFSNKKNDSRKMFDGSKWCSGIISFSGSDIDGIYNKLDEFSKDLDNHIDLINDHWLQIYTYDSEVSRLKNINPSEAGKIDFSINPIECFAVEKRLPISPNYEDMVKVMIGWLWSKADYSLLHVSSLIRNESLSYIVERAETLKKEISNEIDQSKARTEICNSISRAISRMPSQVDTICSWFDRVDKERTEGDYDINTIIDIVSKSLSTKVSVTQNSECRVSNKALNYVVDLFHILFENAISKSKLPPKEVDISVAITKENDTIEIVVCNACHFSDEDVSNLNFYKDAYGYEDLINEVIQEEGGTGFFKIWKILDKDLEINHQIDMNFENTNKFIVTLSLRKSISIY